MLVCIAILVCVFLGAALACAAQNIPSQVVALERCGGALLVFGLALLGGSLHYFGEVHGTASELRLRLIGTANCSDVDAPNRTITAAALGSVTGGVHAAQLCQHKALLNVVDAFNDGIMFQPSAGAWSAHPVGSSAQTFGRIGRNDRIKKARPAHSVAEDGAL
jgi:hypothetical protein